MRRGKYTPGKIGVCLYLYYESVKRIALRDCFFGYFRVDSPVRPSCPASRSRFGFGAVLPFRFIGIGVRDMVAREAEGFKDFNEGIRGFVWIGVVLRFDCFVIDDRLSVYSEWCGYDCPFSLSGSGYGNPNLVF